MVENRNNCLGFCEFCKKLLIYHHLVIYNIIVIIVNLSLW